VELLKSSYVNRGASLIYTERDLMGVNSVTLVGRAGRDPEVRYFESGSMVANLTIAVNRRSRDDEPDWFNLEIWGKQAQVAADYVKKRITPRHHWQLQIGSLDRSQ
jgi:single-strand DNA-binding protein